LARVSWEDGPLQTTPPSPPKRKHPSASALAPNIGAQLTFRFLAGLFGCTAVTTFAGSVADLWTPTERTLVVSLTSAANFSGVFLSPVVGASIG
jgi:MFS family permease